MDVYLGSGDDLLSPASNAAAVVPNDTTDLPTASKRLWIGAAGTVTLMLTRGNAPVTYSVPVAGYLLVRAKRVYASGTTASAIVAEY